VSARGGMPGMKTIRRSRNASSMCIMLALPVTIAVTSLVLSRGMCQ
jgi:hypothetical protein